MTDPRVELRATYADWLRVRANVRALGAALAAAEHRLRRDAGRDSHDCEFAILTEQIAAEQRAIEMLARELDARITQLKGACAAIETGYVDTIVVAARNGLAQSVVLPPA